MDTRVGWDCAGLTVSIVLPEIPFRDALMTDEPWATPVAKPACVMLATAGVEVHVTEFVIFCVLLSL
jgi:hypothetical protein